MSIKERIVSALLRLCPKKWRDEYGQELGDILMKRPLSPRVAGDVVAHGIRQRLRGLEPSTVIGLALLVVMVFLLSWNVTAPPPHGHGLMTILQAPLQARFYVLLLAYVGCWMALHHQATLVGCGIAAAKVSFIAGIPVMIAALLMMVGVLDVAFRGPGQTPPSTFHPHGFQYTLYNVKDMDWGPLGLMIAPFTRLPEAFVWGVLGGLLGRGILHSRQKPATTA